MSLSATKSIRIAILAMGGEGGGVLAGWIVDLAEANGYIVQLTSVPGVAQRTGATNYYLELFPEAARRDGREPVLALLPVPGDVDIVIASELMEAGRAIQRGIVTPDRTTLIASTARVFSMTEKIELGDGRVDEGKLLEGCRAAAKRLIAFDMARIAEEAGSVISASMLGALAGAGVLPFDRAAFEATIARGGVGVAASKRAFDTAFVAASAGEVGPGPARIAEADTAPAPGISPAAALLIADVRASLPAPMHEFAEEGVSRLIDYQDSAYARMFLDRLKPIAELDAKVGDGSFRLSVETARWLALGMAYEDTIRVAELKIRATRFERVAKEVRAKGGEIVEIAEFLHPRLQEIAESVPAPLGRFLQRNWAARRIVEAMTSSGKIVNTTSIRGFLLMATVASLKPRRRSSLRYTEEQQQLEVWLGEVRNFAAKSYDMALEITECRRLVKGYGDTHARGKASYAAILAQARRMPPGPDAAAHIAVLCKAALADETGAKLSAVLKQMAPA